ncbi:MAG: bifunctional 23S rRNA (guanine(2069)-N(7))-methyltransferase RlmK/23S rRNA (guanine(2445)-N(2))-methyltransferase RlmL [Granulosicoccus sp.]
MSFSTEPLQSFDHNVEFYATCGTGLDALLSSELKQLGFSRVQSAGAGVRFNGPLEDGYRACLWSRLANRVLLPIHRGLASTPEALYELVQQIDWSSHLDVDGSLAVDFFTANSEISHSQYGALKVKDAVVDQFRENAGKRPDVDRDTPDIRINVYLFRNQARVAIDLSGSSLHRRGYRGSGGLAPLKENLAAAVLMASGWPDVMAQGKSLFDPMCGSGTLLIEAAMMATRQAPGLLRSYFGFQGWKHHDDTLWQTLLDDARALVCTSPVVIAGADHDPEVVDSCAQNIKAAGLEATVSVSCQPLACTPPASVTQYGPGFLVTNPPYGERLAGDAQFYAGMGTELSRFYGGWMCNLFTAVAAPYARARLPLSSLMKTKNGGIDCVLLQGQIPAAVRADIDRVESGDMPDENNFGEASGDQTKAEHPQAALYRGQDRDQTVGENAMASKPAMAVDATAFVNRLKKNKRALKGWLKQNRISAYRLYDSDLPEFAVAIDVFEEGDTTHCVVQEYQAPQTVNAAMAEARLEAVMQALPDALGTSAENIHLKVRQVKSGHSQYEKHMTSRSVSITVEESGTSLELNLTDYLDTGLFLDHRPVRRYIQQNSAGMRFLNLFSYTGTATVAAVSGGANSSVSVDSSNRYCQWAKRNLDNNGAAAQLHEVVRQDVFSWLDSASLGLSENHRFDLVLLDPPTFSNSSDHENDWNVQRDHVKAIDDCLSIMAPGGLLIFSNNYRRFRIDADLLNNTDRGIRVEDRSRWSIDRDFHRNQRIHQCWFIFKA